jgi:hypothetical protein
MSGWTVITVRGRESQNYEYSEYDDTDPYTATSDIVATMDEDSRVRKWTVWKGHVYAYLNTGQYEFEFAEQLLTDYSEMIADAVVLGANDTTDTGTARYYDVKDTFMGGPERHTDMYAETQSEDGVLVGEMALAVMSARHGIIARDPFHNTAGYIDDSYLDSGTVKDV